MGPVHEGGQANGAAEAEAAKTEERESHGQVIQDSHWGRACRLAHAQLHNLRKKCREMLMSLFRTTTWSFHCMKKPGKIAT